MFRLVAAIIADDLFNDTFRDAIADDALCLCVDVTIVFDRFTNAEIVLFALWAFLRRGLARRPSSSPLGAAFSSSMTRSSRC
jgi:hypothetical protein